MLDRHAMPTLTSRPTWDAAEEEATASDAASRETSSSEMEIIPAGFTAPWRDKRVR